MFLLFWCFFLFNFASDDSHTPFQLYFKLIKLRLCETFVFIETLPQQLYSVNYPKSLLAAYVYACLRPPGETAYVAQARWTSVGPWGAATRQFRLARNLKVRCPMCISHCSSVIRLGVEGPGCIQDVIQSPNQQLMKPVSRCYDSSQNLSIIPERNVIYLFFFWLRQRT